MSFGGGGGSGSSRSRSRSIGGCVSFKTRMVGIKSGGKYRSLGLVKPPQHGIREFCSFAFSFHCDNLREKPHSIYSVRRKHRVRFLEMTLRRRERFGMKGMSHSAVYRKKKKKNV